MPAREAPRSGDSQRMPLPTRAPRRTSSPTEHATGQRPLGRRRHGSSSHPIVAHGFVARQRADRSGQTLATKVVNDFVSRSGAEGTRSGRAGAAARELASARPCSPLHYRDRPPGGHRPRCPTAARRAAELGVVNAFRTAINRRERVRPLISLADLDRSIVAAGFELRDPIGERMAIHR